MFEPRRPVERRGEKLKEQGKVRDRHKHVEKIIRDIDAALVRYLMYARLCVDHEKGDQFERRIR